MKKIAIVLLLSLACLSSLYAQIEFTPKVGTSFATLHFSDDLKPDDSNDVKSKFGFVTGVAIDMPLLKDKLSFQPELLFHQKGYRATNQNGYSSHMTLNYLELPLLIKLKFGKFYGVVGPSVGMGIGGSYKVSATYTGSTTTSKGKVKFGEEPNNNSSDDIYLDNRFDAGVQAGLGILVSVINIELRYALGLISVVDKPEDWTQGEYTLKNSSFLFTIGYPLQAKK